MAGSTRRWISWIAIKELSDKYAELGAPRLFHTMQLHIATCGRDAVYGTVATPPGSICAGRARFRQRSPAEKAGRQGHPSPRDVTLAGLLAPENLLDIVRNFVVFEHDIGCGKVIKKFALSAARRGQQSHRSRRQDRHRRRSRWRGVATGQRQVADHAVAGPEAAPRSATREPDAANRHRPPGSGANKIEGTFLNCGFPSPARARPACVSYAGFLSSPGGRTILSTVQKFQEVGGIAERGRAHRQSRARCSARHRTSLS